MVKKKSLDAQNVLYVTPNFPYVASDKVSKKGARRSLLGIGGNIGDVVRRFNRLFVYLERSSLVHVLETTPILSNPPFGYTSQDDFYNALLLVETQLTAKMLLRYVLRVERLFGRQRSFKDAPRTLDIDIIFYENTKMDTEELTLPHHGWRDRHSVLIPLKYFSRQNKTLRGMTRNRAVPLFQKRYSQERRY